MEETTTNSEEVLKDAGMVQVEGQPPAVEPPTQETPPADPAPIELNSLEDAMRFYNQAKSKPAETVVPDGEDGDKAPGTTTEEPGEDKPGAKGGDDTKQPDTPSTPLVQGDDMPGARGAEELPGGTGEPSGDVEIYDADAGVAEVRKQLIDIAADAVRKDFAKQGIKKLNVNDLVKVDEKNGTKEFINPDTKRPFQSSNPRSEAQAFVNDFNAGLDHDFTMACQQLLPQVEQSYKPIIEFHQFLPRWQQMDEFRQNMFEKLVEGHELRDSQGNIVAYNCNLNEIANVMETQVNYLLEQQKALTENNSVQNNGGSAQPVGTEAPVTQPAVAAKTVQASAPKPEEKKHDVSTVAGAMKYYNEMKAKKGQ